MKITCKLTLAALLATGLLLLSACSSESEPAPTTVSAATTPTPTVTTTAITDTGNPAVTTTPQATTTVPTPATDEPATSEPATTDEPAPATAEELSLAEQMAAMGCPEELLPAIERRANATERFQIEDFLDDPYVEALLVDGFYTPEQIDLRGFIETGVQLIDGTRPNGSPTEEEELAVALAIGRQDVINLDCIRWTSAELDAVTQKYLGIPLSDASDNLFTLRPVTHYPFATVHYLSWYDAYYMVGPDHIDSRLSVISAWRTSDGNYLVHYNGVTDSMVAILTPHEDSFHISLVMELVQNPSAPVQ